MHTYSHSLLISLPLTMDLHPVMHIVATDNEKFSVGVHRDFGATHSIPVSAG